MVTIDAARCTLCGSCIDECPARIFRISRTVNSSRTVSVAFSESCNRCGHCVAICPEEAITHSDLTGPFDPFSPPIIQPAVMTDFLLSRRSTRAFKKRPVPRDVVESLINVGTHAGSASNAQTEGFIVIEDANILRELEGLVVETMWKRLRILGNRAGRAVATLKYGPEVAEKSIHYFERFRDIIKDGDVTGSIFRGAPTVIAVEGLRTNRSVCQNGAVAIRNMEILALSHGLGTCWAGFLLVAAGMSTKIGIYLGLPHDRNIYGALMVGYPRHRYGRRIPRSPRTVRWLSASPSADMLNDKA
jgi:nitroreductase/NAD-dependent dihydropyrimidine dehydrogenase PreA subunit